MRPPATVHPSSDAVEPFGAEYFGSVYRDYAAQNPPAKLAFYRRLAEHAVAGAVRPRVLEVGCGPGLFLGALGPAWERFGTDVSDWAVGEARRNVPGAVVEPSAAGAVPFDGLFDLVAAFDVLEHLPDPGAAVDALVRRLRPRGAMLAVVPVYDGPLGPLVRLLDRDSTHLQKRGRRFWLELLGQELNVETWTGVFRYLMPWRTYIHLPAAALRAVAPAVAILARKDA